MISFDDNTEIQPFAHGFALKLLGFWVCFWKPGSECNTINEGFCLNPGRSGFSITIVPFNPNEKYIVTGKHVERIKYRYPPYASAMPNRDKQTLKGIMRGRI